MDTNYVLCDYKVDITYIMNHVPFILRVAKTFTRYSTHLCIIFFDSCCMGSLHL